MIASLILAIWSTVTLGELWLVVESMPHEEQLSLVQQSRLDRIAEILAISKHRWPEFQRHRSCFI